MTHDKGAIVFIILYAIAYLAFFTTLATIGI